MPVITRPADDGTWRGRSGYLQNLIASGTVEEETGLALTPENFDIFLCGNPGMIETEGLHAAGFAEGDFRKAVESQTPLGRIGQPQDIATVATFLASPDSGWITGETFAVAGGYR